MSWDKVSALKPAQRTKSGIFTQQHTEVVDIKLVKYYPKEE